MYSYYISMKNNLYNKETNISKGNKYCRKGDNSLPPFHNIFLSHLYWPREVMQIKQKHGNSTKTRFSVWVRGDN